MQRWTILVVGLMFGGLGLASPPSAAAQDPSATVVAVTGMPAPGGGNFEFVSTGTPPSLNAAGQVAFHASLSNGVSGVFTGTPGALQAVARSGNPSPAGGAYTGFVGFGQTAVINGSGQVTFQAGLTGTSSPQGLFVGTPGAAQAIALIGTPAPAGGNYFSFQFDPQTNYTLLNDTGHGAFYADLTGGSSVGGLFAGPPGNVQAAALYGGPAPGGGTYPNFGFNEPHALNASGQILFTASRSSAPGRGLFLGVPGAVQSVVQPGEPSPAGGAYSFFSPFASMNGAGRVAFNAQLTGGSFSGGVFSGLPGAIQTVALVGGSGPNGSTFSGAFIPVVNGAGQVAFGGSLTGGPFAQETRGVFLWTAGSIQTVALAGTAAPGGGTFSTFFTERLVGNYVPTPVLNGVGQVAFVADLTGTGVTAANDQGLYAGTVGDLLKIVREGDQLDVDPGPGIILRTVADGGIQFATGSGGQSGRAMSLNDLGFITFSVRFTDGTTAVVRSQVTPVPEPACIGLIAAAGATAAGLLRRWRHRRAA